MITSHLVSLLPVFLVANRTGDFANWKYDVETIYDARHDDRAPGIDSRSLLNDWKYGPEFIYDARIDGTGPGLDKPEKIFTYNTTMKLKCRKKSSTTMSCHFYEPKIIINLIEPDGRYRVVDESEPIKDEYPASTNHVFEYSINNDHDESNVYRISSSMTTSRLDIARSMIEMLRAPEFLHQLQGKVIVKENSSVGIDCETEYATGWNTFDEDIVTNKRIDSYEIMIIPNKTIPIGRSMVIKKTRLLDNCYATLMTVYKNGREGFRTSSMTRMKITRNNFSSITNNELVVRKIGSTDSTVNARETLTLRLEDVIPATGPPPTINDSQTHHMAGTRVFHSYSAQEYLLTK